MCKKFFIVSFFIVLIIISGLAFAQNEASTGAAKTEQTLAVAGAKADTAVAGDVKKEEIVKGVVKKIAEDSSYIMVDETKVLTTKEFLEDSYLEIGDKVEITAEKTDAGLKATNYNYIFEDEEDTLGTETLEAEPEVTNTSAATQM